MKMQKVFEPGQIGTMKLKNHLIVSAMSSHMGNDDGTPNQAVNEYLVRKTQGGWGLIFTEDLGVTQDAGSDPIVGSLWSDAQIPAWTETVRQVHQAGGLIGAQLYHAGRQRALKAYPTHPVAPSAIKEPAMPYVPRELTVEEIHQLVQAFGQSAARAKACGFDCIEIHGAHGYLVNQFMSPFSNKRTGETAVGNRVNCLANPHTCRETEYDLSPVAQPKKVFIAGGGVAGLSAMQGAAERGHKVVLFEAENELGGQWLAAAACPGKTEYTAMIYNYRRIMDRCGIKLRLNTPLTRQIVEAEKPDAVIVATGSQPLFLPITGLDDRSFVKTALEVLRGQVPLGKRVVVAGGGMTGAETAVFLAVQGCRVTLIEMAPDIITDAVSQPRACLLEHLRQYQVQVHTNTRLTRVDASGTVYAEEFGEPVEFKHMDMLVNAMGVRSHHPLMDELAGCGCKVVAAGDAASAKNGYKNIREGFDAGNGI